VANLLLEVLAAKRRRRGQPANLPVGSGNAGRVAHQATGGNKLAYLIDCGNPMSGRERDIRSRWENVNDPIPAKSAPAPRWSSVVKGRAVKVRLYERDGMQWWS